MDIISQKVFVHLVSAHVLPVPVQTMDNVNHAALENTYTKEHVIQAAPMDIGKIL